MYHARFVDATAFVTAAPFCLALLGFAILLRAKFSMFQ
jgi:hypothetical protein